MKTQALPIFLNSKNKYPVGIAAFAFATAIYVTSNHFPIFTPNLLPMTWLDLKVPFVPLTVWFYVSEYIFFAIVYIVAKDSWNLNKWVYSSLALQTLSVIIFWVWPTTYPRELYPLPQDLGPLTHSTFESLRQMDAPTNCCPSLHVSSVYLGAFIFLDEQIEKFPLFLAWASVIALSTLTTKQHYFVDVVAGLALAVLFYWIFHKKVDYRALGAASGDQAKR